MSDVLTTYYYLLPFSSQKELASITNEGRVRLLEKILRQAPSENNWQAVAELFASWPDSNEKMQALDYANRLLHSWDDSLRHLSSSWRYLYKHNGLATLAKITRRISIYQRQANGNEELKRIAGSPLAENILWLEITKSEIYTDALRILLGSGYMNNLQVLSFSDITLSGDDIHLLFNAAWPSLVMLRMKECGLKNAAIALLLKAPFIQHVRELDIAHNLLDNETVALLAMADTISHIRVLRLKGNFINDKGAAMLAAMRNLQHLEILDIRGNVLSAAGVRIIRDSPLLKQVKILADIV